MDRETIAEIVRAHMPADYYLKPGGLLVSGADTLRAAPAYVMGLNPGGDPAKISTPIIENIAPPNGTSNYTHDCWQPKCVETQPCSHVGPDGSILSAALVKHQRNMIALTEVLGVTPATIFSANAIFGRSTSLATLKAQTGFNLADWWQVCWPVHQAFLGIVRPKIIVTLGYGAGSSAFGLLHGAADKPEWRKIGDAGRKGGWTFDATFTLPAGERLHVRVVGVPHPSYFAPGPILAGELAAMVMAS